MNFRVNLSLALFSSSLLTFSFATPSIAENYVDIFRKKNSTVAIDKDSYKQTNKGYSFILKETFYPGEGIKYIKGSYEVDCKNKLFITNGTYTVYTNGRYHRSTKGGSERPNLDTIGDFFLTEFCQ